MSSSTVAAVTSTSTSTTTTVPALATTTSAVPDEIVKLLDELDAAWTAGCDQATREIAQLRVQMVLDWAPSYEQALGSFGGAIDDGAEDIAAVLSAGCPEAGFVIRFIDVVDDELPGGEVNTMLALSPMLEPSLQALGWVIGIPLAERLAPEVADSAPATPRWDPTTAGSCAQLETRLHDYFLTYIESLNTLSPAQAYDWDGMSSGPGSWDDAGNPLDTVTDADCDLVSAVEAVLAGLAEAEAVSFVAETARWGLVSTLRDYLVDKIGSDSSLALSDTYGGGTTRSFTLTNDGAGAVSEVTIEGTGQPCQEDGSAEEGTPFFWSVDSIAPGETVVVESTISQDQQLESLLAWIDTNGVTRHEYVTIGCFIQIVDVDPDS